KKYLAVENPDTWLFNGKEIDGRYSPNGLSWVMREALKKTSIQKKVNLNSLRHSYATHLLEDGINRILLATFQYRQWIADLFLQNVATTHNK
ncbi:MAG: tyrosine-type recombinase/integrase, partial [Bacteroidales bacterium]|nr:tyrosine-type recombinase/integrase [Bacteroidales bacterium]